MQKGWCGKGVGLGVLIFLIGGCFGGDVGGAADGGILYGAESWLGAESCGCGGVVDGVVLRVGALGLYPLSPWRLVTCNLRLGQSYCYRKGTFVKPHNKF